MRKKAPRALLLCLLVSVGLAACQDEGKPKRSTAALPKPAPVVRVTLRDYRFDYDRAIPSGRVVFRIVNKGGVPHRPALLPLPEDLPPIKEQLRGSKRRAVSPFAGVPDRAPGQSGSFAVDLIGGRRYGLICYARDRDGSSHALKGMASEFRTRRDAPSSRDRGER